MAMLGSWSWPSGDRLYGLCVWLGVLPGRWDAGTGLRLLPGRRDAGIGLRLHVCRYDPWLEFDCGTVRAGHRVGQRARTLLRARYRLGGGHRPRHRARSLLVPRGSLANTPGGSFDRSFTNLNGETIKNGSDFAINGGTGASYWLANGTQIHHTNTVSFPPAS